MKANTAVGLGLGGISLWLLLRGEFRAGQRRAARILGAVVALLGTATLAELVFGVNLRIDQLVVTDGTRFPGWTAPGRMAPTSAAEFLIIGLALVLVGWKTKRGRQPAQVLSLIAGLIGLMSVAGYLYHASALYRIQPYIQIAAHTAVAMSLLSLAIFFARPREGIAGELTGEGSGSVMARRMLTAIFFVPIFLGWIYLRGQRAGLYEAGLGIAVFAAANVVVFALIVWLSARKTNAEYRQRNSAENILRDLNAHLEERVAGRTKVLEQQAIILAAQAALINLTPDAIFVRDMSGRVIFWNQGAERLYGRSAKEAMGRVTHELLQTSFPIPLEDIEAQMTACGDWEGEISHLQASGARITVESRWAFQRDAQGNPCAILEVNHDITQRKRMEEALRQSDERLRLLVSGVKDYAILMLDPEGRVTSWNEGAQRIKGYRADEIIGEHFSKFYAPEAAADGHPDRELKFAAEHGRYEEEGWRVRKDGSRFWANVAITALRDSAGQLRGFGKVTRDITERKQAEDALFAEKERAQVTLNSIGDAVICTDAAENITFLNPAAEKMMGLPLEEATGRRMGEVFGILDAMSRENITNPMVIAAGEDRASTLPSNCILVRRDGVEIPVEDSVAPIHDREGKPTGAVVVFRDVSAAREMAQRLAHSAHHDFLTGLPNRMLLNDRVTQAIALAPRHLKKVAVLFLDLDGFKHINDSLGHPIGDQLLQSIAKCLLDCVRVSDTVSRQGGDEFVVLLSEVEHTGDAAITAGRMLEAVSRAHCIDQHDLYVTTSIGLSVFPDDGLDAETLIKNADTAMYQAKENGRQSYQFFKPAMNIRAVERQSMEEHLRTALQRHEFELHYQPKINLRTGAITGAEALIRWTHPTRGPIPPGLFIPVAEDSGLIVAIGNWGLREACRQSRAWLDAGLALGSMAVNISAMEFRDDHFLDGVLAALNHWGLDPCRLELELTESVLMKRAESAESILAKLRARGVQVALDDFGTGYSSLSYLRKFPIDSLKIDQSFVRQISTNPDETTIVTAIIKMGQSLKLRVVAEGVETERELAFLQAHDCDEAQGYYFRRPVPAEQFAKMLEIGIPHAVPHAVLQS
jgi:diguanylate cyclase (GGDEF)-like protein/PAS domain S-box-containing protein